MLNHYALEPSAAGGTRHYSIARHLLRHGWRSTILASSVELNTGRQRLKTDEKHRLSEIDGVDFLWVRTPTYSGNGPGRIRNMLLYAWRVQRSAITDRIDPPDVVVGSSVHPFAALAGAKLARRYGVPFIFEVRDLWPQTLIDLGRLGAKSLIARGLRRLELYLYRRADRIIVLLPHVADYIIPLGIPAKKIVWIPNGVELDDYPTPRPPPEADVFSFMYFGAHGQANGLDHVLRAMAVLQTDSVTSNIRLRLIGDGPQKEALRRLAEDLKLGNVSFESPVAKSEVPRLAAEADAFVFNLVDAPVFKYGISSNKLFDFMAAGRPVVFCCNAPNDPVRQAACGLTVKPGQPAALACAMKEMAAMPKARRDTFGRKGREYAEQRHSYRTLGLQFGQVLDSAAPARTRS